MTDIKDIINILGLLANQPAQPAQPSMSNEADPDIGKFVIVRCHDAGVHAGVLESRNGRECRLSSSRRLWYWCVPEGKGSFLSGVSQHGLGADCKIGETINITLTEICEVIPCSKEAELSIRDYATHERSH